MKIAIVGSAVATLVSALIANAQQLSAPAPPAFVPYTIDEKTNSDIVAYLNEQPAKIANPLLMALARLEQGAVAQANQAKIRVPDADASAKARTEREKTAPAAPPLPK